MDWIDEAVQETPIVFDDPVWSGNRNESWHMFHESYELKPAAGIDRIAHTAVAGASAHQQGDQLPEHLPMGRPPSVGALHNQVLYSIEGLARSGLVLITWRTGWRL